MKESVFLISAFSFLIILTYFVGLSISHHLFLVYFVLSLFFFRKNGALMKYGLPCLLIVLWVLCDAISYAPHVQNLP